MAIADRTARTDWEGTLARGNGLVTPDSGAFEPLPVTWASRTEQPGGKTSPEELLAGAHSACFSMALNLVLGEQGIPADRTSVSSTVTFDEVDGKPTVTKSAITVRASVPGADEAKFQAAVKDAADLCPVSRLFASAEITVEATLE
ncbi:MAG TPA: OsmC family peroxiredoxin [Marmoricola sp.]|nr:OsmC family peroxiredoxin [Marmoricola sp.]